MPEQDAELRWSALLYPAVTVSLKPAPASVVNGKPVRRGTPRSPGRPGRTSRTSGQRRRVTTTIPPGGLVDARAYEPEGVAGQASRGLWEGQIPILRPVVKRTYCVDDRSHAAPGKRWRKGIKDRLNVPAADEREPFGAERPFAVDA